MICECCGKTIDQIDIDFNNVIRDVCQYFNIKQDLIYSKRRDRKIVNVRNIIIDLIYYNPFQKYTMAEIGKHLGNRDHTTIINSIKKVNEWVEYDHEFREMYLKAHKIIFGNLDQAKRKKAIYDTI